MAAPADQTSPLVRTPSDLEAYFHRGAKPRDNWRIGVEYEKPVVDATTGDSVPFDGTRGIERLLHGIRSRFPTWTGIEEGGRLIALEDGLASITLEPGGQLEMSGQQCASLHCAREELERHVQEILTVGEPMGLKFLGLGIVPKTELSSIPWMPKQRYRIMREIMGRTGTLGRRMMAQTATVQCNFDYSSESDALAKMRLALALGPILVAVSANSPIVDGSPTGFLSYRAHIWTDTDRARCGHLPFVFEGDSLFRAYTEYALDVPMYFLWRQGRYHEVGGMTFRRFLEIGFESERATLADWSLHLTTLFPEVRLKSYLEVRSADSQPPELLLATPALMKGLLYDDDCRLGAWDVVKRWNPASLADLQEEAARRGLRARVGRIEMRELALELLTVARAGLVRQSHVDSRGRSEEMYLDRLEEEVEAGHCPASRILQRWDGEWGRDVARLIDASAYRQEPIFSS